MDCIFFTDDVALTGNSCCCDWLVASHHDDFDSGCVALGDSEGHCVTGWIVERNYSHKDLFIEWEIGFYHLVNRVIVFLGVAAG